MTERFIIDENKIRDNQNCLCIESVNENRNFEKIVFDFNEEVKNLELAKDDPKIKKQYKN